MKTDKIHILYVDDELINLKLFKISFKKEFEIHLANSGEEALQILEKEKDKIKVVVTDNMMPGMTGVQLLEKIYELYPDIPPSRLIISGYSKSKDVDEAYQKYNLFRFISKPWNKSNVQKTIYESINMRNYA